MEDDKNGRNVSLEEAKIVDRYKRLICLGCEEGCNFLFSRLSSWIICDRNRGEFWLEPWKARYRYIAVAMVILQSDICQSDDIEYRPPAFIGAP